MGLPVNSLFQLSARRMLYAVAIVWGVSAVTAAAWNLPSRWRWSNPAPHGGNVVDMAYHPYLLLGVQVAERGQIYTSDDLDLWLPRESKTTNALRAVTFLGSRILITGENGCVLYADSVNDFRSGVLLDGSTGNWLEGVAASPSLAVAVGDNGSIYTSANGIAWKKQSANITNWLRGVVYGPSGAGLFVAVGEYGGIFASANGTNWSRRTSNTTRHLNRVAFANSRFTAVGDGGLSLVSVDGGSTWQSDPSGATNGLEHAASAGISRLLVGYDEVRLHNGLGWANELAKADGPPTWTYYSAIGQPGFFLIAGQTGMQSEGYQTNGTPFFWLTPFDSVRNWLWDVTYASNVYVAVGDFGTVMTSGNGVNWTLELVPKSATNTTFLGVGGTTNLLLAVGDSGQMIYSPNSLTNVVYTNGSGGVVTQVVSSLGVIWYPMPATYTTNDLQGVAVLTNSLYVVTGAKGTVLVSPDGTNWSPRSSSVPYLLSSVTEWPGGLVATGDDGTIISSSNGSTWSQRTSGTTNWLYRVRYLNGYLIAVGQNGTILTSTNTTNWNARVSGTTRWLNDVVFIGDTWFALGNNGTVLASTNLAAWTNIGTITKKSLFAAATDSRRLITVGVEGVILRSQVLPDLTPIEVLAYERFTLTNTVPVRTQNLFLFGGQTDQRFTVDRNTRMEGTAWTTGQLLEIFDSSGTLYFVETIFGTNQSSQEFYRTTLKP